MGEVPAKRRQSICRIRKDSPFSLGLIEIMKVNECADARVLEPGGGGGVADRAFLRLQMKGLRWTALPREGNDPICSVRSPSAFLHNTRQQRLCQRDGKRRKKCRLGPNRGRGGAGMGAEDAASQWIPVEGEEEEEE